MSNHSSAPEPTRKIVWLVAIACLVTAVGFLALLYFLFSREGPRGDAVPSAAEARHSDASDEPQPLSRREWQPMVAVEAESLDSTVRTVPAETGEPLARDLPDVMDFEASPDEITIHLASDFFQGDLSNLVAEDMLRLAEGSGFAPRGAPPGQRAGVYLSPEVEAILPFDIVITEVEATIPPGSALVVEFRVLILGGTWSVWERVEPNEMSRPLGLGSPAAAWQYRLSFFAEENAEGPEVHSVAFVTRPVLTDPAPFPLSAESLGEVR